MELLVLSSIPERDFVEAPTLIHDLDEYLPHWNPERGTIYPLLHRLTAQKLLEKSTSGKTLKFKRTESATSFLSSLISSNGLISQFETSVEYLNLLVQAMIGIDPFAAEKLIEKFSQITEGLLLNIEKYKKMTRTAIEDEKWVQIDIE
ncbi:MAG: helix-turn-helix transcriptional regulator [Candidatus Kariarchaeaceae archaeon]